MSLEGINGVNPQINTMSNNETKAASDESNDTSIFEKVKDTATLGVAGKIIDAIDNNETLQAIKDAALNPDGSEALKDDLESAKEHFSNGEFLEGIADTAKGFSDAILSPSSGVKLRLFKSENEENK